MDQRLLRRRRARKKHKTGLSKFLKEFKPDFMSSTGCRRFACDQLQFVIQPLLAFFKDSSRVLKRCTKPNRHEFRRSVLATIFGFIIMGFLGFIIKLLHMPITNIIMG